MLPVKLSVKVKLPSGVSEVVLDVMSKSSQYISFCVLCNMGYVLWLHYLFRYYSSESQTEI
jgi:hypothetical protein